MSKLTFSTIPEVPLLLIFNKIPLNDLLLNVNLVNRHWNTISAVARQHRQRLVLSLFPYANYNDPFCLIIDSVFTDPFEASKNMQRYFGGEQHSYIVPKARKRLNRQSIERLVSKLPNISTLEVNLIYLPISTSDLLATLINGWREHLVTLKLFTEYKGNSNQSLLARLAQLTNLHTTINSLPFLHHLTYQLDFQFNRNYDQMEPLTFPIACQSLKELYFTSNEFRFLEFNSAKTVQLFANAFRDYVQSEEASGLSKISCIIFQQNRLDNYLATSDVLSSKTTHIALDTEFFTETKLWNFSRKFYNLTNITLKIYISFPVDKFSKCLSILENLKHITFTYTGDEDDEEFDEMWSLNDDSHPDRVRPKIDKITPLVRVKSVHFDLDCLRWHQFMAEDMCFDLVFPNVELISINMHRYRCVHCGGYFDREMKITTRKAEWHNCIGPFLAPIAKCDKLKRIEYEDEGAFDFCWTLDQFKLDWADFLA